MDAFGRPRQRAVLWAVRLKPGIAWPGRMPDFPRGWEGVPAGVAKRARAPLAAAVRQRPVRVRAQVHLAAEIERLAGDVERLSAEVTRLLARAEQTVASEMGRFASQAQHAVAAEVERLGTQAEHAFPPHVARSAALLAAGVDSTAERVRAIEAEAAPRAAALLRDESGTPALGAAGIGLGGAQLAFAATFRGPRERFWDRMTLTGVALGTYALVANPALRRTRPRPRDVAIGLASAAVLYGTFAIGDRFARRFVPGGGTDIADIYELRDLRPKPEIAARLVTVIAPAEELFWRGLIQEATMAAFGRWPGAVLAALAYAGVHLATGNFTLFGAAGIAGAQWCALYAAGAPMSALIVSHTVWDVWIFLLQPTSEVSRGDSAP